MELFKIKLEKSEGTVIMANEGNSGSNRNFGTAENQNQSDTPHHHATDKRRQSVRVPPPPPRISDTMANGVRNSEHKSNLNHHSFAAAVSANLKSLNKNVPMSPSLPPPPKSSSLSMSIKQKEPTTQTSTPPPRGLQSGSSSPYSPFDNEEDDHQDKDKGVEKLTNSSTTPKQSAKEVIELFSTAFKSREDSLASYKMKFHNLRKLYDTKKAELSVVQEHVKELRKKVEILTQEKSTVAHSNAKEKQHLEDQVKSLEMEIKEIREEKDVHASGLSSRLEYTKIALDGQKILYDMQTSKLAQCENEVSQLKQVKASQETVIENMTERIKCLENALKQDVDDKNMMVASFNTYMQKSQNRITELFEDKPFTIAGKKEGQLSLSTCRTIHQQDLGSPRTKESYETVAIAQQSNNGLANVNNSISTATATGAVEIKTEIVSPGENERNGFGEGMKRKDPVEDDDDSDSSDSVIVISHYSKFSPRAEGQCSKKQRFE